MSEIAYTLDYIQRALNTDARLDMPDRSKANGTLDTLTGLYFAHNAGGKLGAQRAWALIKQQNPALAKMVENQQTKVIHADDLKYLQQPSHLLEAFPIYADAFNVVVGPSGGGKSFLAVDIASRIALDYNVMYVAGEGLMSYAVRWEAWKSYHQVSQGRLYFYPEAVQITDEAGLDFFFADVRRYAPRLLIIDTLARSALGVDENSARDMGLFVGACDRIRNELNCGLVIVHHTGKSGEIRGSTALYGAADAVLAVAKIDGLVRVSNRGEHGGKNKYGEDDFESWYKITSHSVMLDVDGETKLFDGAVLAPAEKLKDSALEINDREQSILLALSRAETGAMVKELSATCNMKQAGLYKILNKLKANKFIRKEHEKFVIEEKGLEALETLGVEGDDDE